MSGSRLLGVLLYPGQEGGDARVHAGVLALAAADAPRHDAHLRPAPALVHHQRAAAVALEYEKIIVSKKI